MRTRPGGRDAQVIRASRSNGPFGVFSGHGRRLIWHLAALVAICTFRFAANHEFLLTGIDGSYATFSQYPGALFSDPLSALNLSPYFGLGAAFPGPSPFTDPFGLFFHATGSVVAAYVLLAVFVFLATYAFAYSLETGSGVAVASGWGMVLALLPVLYGYRFMIEVAALLHPSSTFVTVLYCIVMTLFIQTGRYGLWGNTAMAAGFVVVIAISWVNNLTFMVLALPFTAASLAIFTVTATSRREVVWKIACLALAAAVYSWLGIQAFLDAFTAYSQRLDSMSGNVTAIAPANRTYLLNLINNSYYRQYHVLIGAPLLGWLGFAGLIHGVLMGNYRWRLLCFAGLGVIAVLSLMSAEFMLPTVIWPWAEPGYFERATFPVYVIAATLLLKYLGKFLLDLIKNQTKSASILNEVFSRPRYYERGGLVGVATFVAALTLFGMGVKTFAYEMTAAPVTWPDPDGPWQKVAKLVPVERGKPFRGWFANFYGDDFISNVQIWRSGGATLFAMQAEGNLLGGALSRLGRLAPLDRRLALMGAYGLTYVRLPGDVPADDVVQPAKDDILSGIYRIVPTNLGDFTPTEIIKIENFDEFESLVSASDIDWRRTVFLDPVTADKVGKGLVSAKRVIPPVVVTNGLKLAAETDGRSVLLLPRQFSNCYVWRPDPGSSVKVTIIRANMLQVALLFEGTMSGTLKYYYRWSGSARCRAMDPVQARALEIRPLPNKVGHLGPLGYYVLLSAQRHAIERNLARANDK